jgi:hypothetical protein
VTTAAGGLPVIDVTATKPALGLPVTEAVNGRGIPVTKVSLTVGGLPVTFVSETGGAVADPAEYINAATTPPPETNAGGYSLGMVYKMMVAGEITAIRLWRATASSSTGRLLRVYNKVTTVLLGSAMSVETVGDDKWVEATLGTPVAVTAGLDVVAAFNEPNSYRAFSGNCPVVNAAHATYVEGRYDSAGINCPSNGQLGQTYYIDLKWRPA